MRRRHAAEKADQAEIEVGERLKTLRIGAGLSLRALGDRSGVTFGGLSQIENGRSSPSVGTLKKILAALDTTLGDFFATPGDAERAETFVHRAAALVNVAGGSGIKYMALPGQARDRAMQLMWEVYPPGKGTGPHKYTHAGEECGLCVKGQIELTVEGRREILQPGDAYYFDSTRPHRFRNVGTTVAILVSTCTPPSF